MAASNLVLFICLVESVLFSTSKAESGAATTAASQRGEPWNSEKYTQEYVDDPTASWSQKSYMPWGNHNYGTDYTMYTKSADVVGSYGGVDSQRYVSHTGLDYAKHMAMHLPKASSNEPSALPASQFFAGPQGERYNQYVGNYANGYDKLMGQGQATAQADNFNSMGKTFADHQDYQAKYTSGQPGHYQEYMKQYTGGKVAHQTYMGDYEHYSKYASTGGSSNGQAGSHLKHMELYATGQPQEHSAQGGAYQEYMENFAHGHSRYPGQASDYQKFVQDYDHSGYTGHGAVDKGSGYAKHMDRLATDYTKYFSQPGDYQKYTQGHATGDHVSVGSDKFWKSGDIPMFTSQLAGDHAKYAANFAKDYSKYPGQTGDYQAHAQDYSHPGSGKVGDFSKFMDYGKHSPSSHTGDYKNFVENYATTFHNGFHKSNEASDKANGRSTYMDEFADDHSSAMDRYMGHHQGFTREAGGIGGAGGYQKYMGKYSGSMKQWHQAGEDPSNVGGSHEDSEHKMRQDQHSSNSTASVGAAQFFAAPQGAGAPQTDFREQYAGKYMNSVISAVSSHSDQHAWKESFKQQYFQQYAHYEQARKSLQSKFPHVPNSVSECKNLSQVKEWEAAEIASIDAYVPEEYRKSAIAAMKKDASDSIKELQHKLSSASTPQTIADQSVIGEASKRGATTQPSTGGTAFKPSSLQSSQSSAKPETQTDASEEAASPSAAQFIAAEPKASHDQHMSDPLKVAAYEKAMRDYADSKHISRGSPEGTGVSIDEMQKQHFQKEFAGNWAPSQSGASHNGLQAQQASKYMSGIAPGVSNYSDQHAWKESFKQQYFGQYAQYEASRKAVQAKFPHVPNSVSECQNASQVKEWEAAETASIDVMVPKEYHATAMADVKKAASERIAELNADAATSNRIASSSKSEPEEAVRKVIEHSDTKKAAVGTQIQSKNGKQSVEPAASASFSAAEHDTQEPTSKAKEFLQAHKETDGVAQWSSMPKDLAASSTRRSGLAFSSVLAHGGPADASLPAIAGLLSVVAFASVSVVVKRRQLLKPSTKVGLASPLLQA